MATHNLAVIIKHPSNEAQFLLVKQTRPPKFNDPEYDSYLDSDLWDLPSTKLTPLDTPSDAQVIIQNDRSCSETFNFSTFDISSALTEVLVQVGIGLATGMEWKYQKCIEEPEFGPGSPVKTVYIEGRLGGEEKKLKAYFDLSAELCNWMTIESCLKMLLEVKPGSDRVGPLVVIGLVGDSIHSGHLKVPSTLRVQEYPPGVKLVPMGSRTAKPFHTTNLVVIAPVSDGDGYSEDGFVAHGDALMIDPGCKSAFHEELREITAAMPRKLVVFVTHHHYDHIDGLSVVQKCNPDARLLAHENTMCRIGKDALSLQYVPVSGSEQICIGGHRFRIISAPGHTDGHMALLHLSTHSLIVGDHCVGQGSAVLDIMSGGNISDYFQTTYNFLELSPHVLIPMHGRVNMWPKHMLCGHLKNRRNRESTILKAIENGAETLFDIVAYTYAEVDHSFWIPAASNVKLHVDHLAQQDKLPKVDFIYFRPTVYEGMSS